VSPSHEYVVYNNKYLFVAIRTDSALVLILVIFDLLLVDASHFRPTKRSSVCFRQLLTMPPPYDHTK